MKKKVTKKSEKKGTTSPWIDHVKKVQAQKSISYKEALTEAAKTYKK